MADATNVGGGNAGSGNMDSGNASVEPDAYEETPQLRARRERMQGRQKARRGGPLLAILMLLGFLALAALVLFPDQAKRLFGLGTSDVEEMQRTSTVDDSGISTIIAPAPQPEITIENPAPDITVVVPEPSEAPEAELSAEATARLAALEEALTRLADRPAGTPGPTAAEIQALLDRQSEALRAEAENRERVLVAQIEALRAAAEAQPAVTSDNGMAEAERLRIEAEERRRLRERAEAERERQLAELERRRAEREAELRERRVSDANVFDEGEEGTPSPGASSAREGIDEASRRDRSWDLSGDERFLARAAGQEVRTVRARSLGDTSRTIVQGTVIPAVLETAIDTQLPGTIRAQVSRPVFGLDGSRVLMPAGTRLIGTYNTDVSIAQRRVLIAWTRAVTPEGEAVTLAATGTDTLGRVGQGGNVDTRFRERFGSAALVSLISAVPALAGGGDRTDGSNAGGVLRDAGTDVSEDLGEASEDALDSYLKLPPVIRVPQGTRMRVMVNQDLDFS